MNHPSASFFVLAWIYLSTICQLIDRPMLWQASGVSAAAVVPLKTLIEELCELFAYAALAYSRFEAMILPQSLSQETQRTDMPLWLVADEIYHAAQTLNVFPSLDNPGRCDAYSVCA